MKHSILIGLAASTLAMAAFANDADKSTEVAGPAAAHANATGAPTFESLDSNSDGRITTSESMSAKDLSAGFKKADVNSDGAIDKSEFDSWKSSDSSKTTVPAAPGSSQ